MTPTWHDTFSDHAQTAEHRAALDDARRRIDDALRTYHLPYVAFSGGVDSLCCLDLMARRDAPFVVGHYDFGRPDAKASNVFPEWLEREVESVVCGHYGLPLHVVTKRRNFTSQTAMTANRHDRVTVHVVDDGEFWIKGAQRIARSLGCTCNVVGLRAQESVKRKHRTTSANWVSQDMPEVWPVAQWSDLDRWAYVVTHGLPYSVVYDRKAEVEGTYMGLRMRSLHDDSRKAVSDHGVDGSLFWRDRPRG
jgi:3'-phosphoadenosine 5'-phosphosulfate sulfotransferase (PAPS reductase)/FAD synthetase